MDYLLSLLNSAVGNQEVARLLFIGAITCDAVLAVVTVALLVIGLQDPVQRRLKVFESAHLRRGSHRAEQPAQLMLEQVGERFAGNQDWHNSPTRTLLVHAGYRQPWATQDLLGCAPAADVGAGRDCRTGLAVPQGGVVPARPDPAAGRGREVGWICRRSMDKRKQARMRFLVQTFPMHSICWWFVSSRLGVAAVHRTGGRGVVGKPWRAGRGAGSGQCRDSGRHLRAEALRHLADGAGMEDRRSGRCPWRRAPVFSTVWRTLCASMPRSSVIGVHAGCRGAGGETQYPADLSTNLLFVAELLPGRDRTGDRRRCRTAFRRMRCGTGFTGSACCRPGRLPDHGRRQEPRRFVRRHHSVLYQVQEGHRHTGTPCAWLPRLHAGDTDQALYQVLLCARAGPQALRCAGVGGAYGQQGDDPLAERALNDVLKDGPGNLGLGELGTLQIAMRRYPEATKTLGGALRLDRSALVVGGGRGADHPRRADRRTTSRLCGSTTVWGCSPTCATNSSGPTCLTTWRYRFSPRFGHGGRTTSATRCPWRANSGCPVAYQQALGFNASYKPAWRNYGMLLARMGNYEEALSAFEQVETRASNDAGYVLDQGQPGTGGAVVQCHR